MHDIADLEARGVPGVFVATVEFVRAAEQQSRAIGAELGAVFIEHPIQDRSDDEMIALGDRHFEAIAAALVMPSPAAVGG